jgi:hypothetical protein
MLAAISTKWGAPKRAAPFNPDKVPTAVLPLPAVNDSLVEMAYLADKARRMRAYQSAWLTEKRRRVTEKYGHDTTRKKWRFLNEKTE